MIRSESITTIAAALAKAHVNIGAAAKGAENPFFKSRYADLGDVLAVCKEPLTAQGIIIVQMPYTKDGGETWLETLLLHSSGEYLGSELKVTPTKANDPQSLGSAITYCRRYSLQALLSIPSVDDDAEWAERALKNKPEPMLPKEIAAGPVVDRHDPKKPEVSTSQPADWREVICHVGKPDGPVLGKRLGELNAHLIQWLSDKVLPTLGKSAKDKTLAAAITEAVAATPVEVAQPEAAPETPKAEEKPVETAKRAKKEPPKPAPEAPMEWRSVKVHLGAKLAGKTLAEILAAEKGSLIKEMDGREMLAWLAADGVKKLEAKGAAMDVKDKVLVNAIKAAVAETGILMDRAGLQDMLLEKIEGLGVDVLAFNQRMRDAKIFDGDETLTSVGDAMLHYLAENWPSVAEAAKGDK